MDTLEPMLQGLRKQFESGKTRSYDWRKAQLERVLDMVEIEHEKITSTVRMDHGGPKLRGLGEIGCHKGAEFALSNLKTWMADTKVPTPFDASPTRMGSSWVRNEPKGVVLIIAPWNYPLELVLTPLVSAIAAGNCVVVKPSEVSSNSAVLIEELINKYLDTSCIKVVQGSIPETTALLKLQWDHIMYTGNGFVGKIVMRAAAEHLTPVTLELGGKSPVIVDKSAKIDTVVSRVNGAKWFNVGQTCIAPDYVLVHKDLEEEFFRKIKISLEKSYGEDASGDANYGKIINANHINRLKSMLDKSSGKIITSTIAEVNTEKRFFPPTIVHHDKNKLDEPLLQEEIFGPILPCITIDSVEEGIEIVKKICSKPLALYVFSEDSKVVANVLGNTQSGGACVNTCIEHFMNIHLPFGGIGPSGFGACHGKFGFEDFSHRRSCFKQDTLIKKDANLPPPEQCSDKMYDILIKILVTGFVPRKSRTIVRQALFGLFLCLGFYVIKNVVLRV